MKISTSYFYQIRNFQPNMIPISTAIWDPKWFHKNGSNGTIFFDKRKILNGLRLESFAPGESCENLCKGKPCNFDKNTPDECLFLENYKKQLDNLDFNSVMEDLSKIEQYYQTLTNIKDVHIVLIFYETPDNECSERKAVQDYFKEHNIKVEELIYPIGENYECR